MTPKVDKFLNILGDPKKYSCQVIPGKDQNTIPTNQEATGNKLDLKSFSGDFWCESVHWDVVSNAR